MSVKAIFCAAFFGAAAFACYVLLAWALLTYFAVPIQAAPMTAAMIAAGAVVMGSGGCLWRLALRLIDLPLEIPGAVTCVLYGAVLGMYLAGGLSAFALLHLRFGTVPAVATVAAGGAALAVAVSFAVVRTRTQAT